MRHLLTTLEGDRFRQVPRRSMLVVPEAPLMGYDETFQAQMAGSLGLGGWLSDVSSYTSKKITQVKESNIPGLSQVASGVRSGGEALSSIGTAFSSGSGTGTAPMTPEQYAASTKDNSTLYIAAAIGVGLLFWLKGK